MSELIWDGKYENNSFTMKDGRIVGKRAAPLRIQLPFQTVETVNESAQDRDRMKDLFDEGEETDWRALSLTPPYPFSKETFDSPKTEGKTRRWRGLGGV